MKMMVRPSSRSRRAMVNSVSTSLGVSGAVGSSMMMRRLSDAERTGDLDHLLVGDGEGRASAG